MNCFALKTLISVATALGLTTIVQILDYVYENEGCLY
jgi:hypothetical protein